MINPKYYPLIANLLEMASDEYANRSCNDFDLSEILPNVEDRRQLAQSMEEQNDSPEEFDPENNYTVVSNSWLLGYFASLFESYTAKLPSDSPYERCHQELVVAYTRLSALLQSLNKPNSKATSEENKRINDEIITIREAIARAENCIPRYIAPE